MLLPPPVKPISVSRASPGPLTTQPITDSVSGVVIWASRSSRTSTVLITWNCWRAQDGHEITRQVSVPIVADIHFHYKRAIEAAENGAACLRINPGNIGSPERVRDVVKAAKDYGCSMRIGVNAGSLEKDLLEKYGEPCPEAMVESALFHAKILQDHDFHEFKISV